MALSKLCQVYQNFVWYYNVPLSSLNINNVRSGNNIYLSPTSVLELETTSGTVSVSLVSELKEGFSGSSNSNIDGAILSYNNISGSYVTGVIRGSASSGISGSAYSVNVNGFISFAIFEYDGSIDSGSVSFELEDA